jgi:predicted small lipoprotein YifL
MRRLFRSVVALAALAAGLPGCGKSQDARAPAPPASSGDRAEDTASGALSEVTLVVPGMT